MCWGASGRPQPSQWAPTSVGGVGGACAPLLAAGSRPNRPESTNPNLSLDMLQTYVLIILDILEVCCKCFIWALQKLIGTMHMLQWLYTYVASVRCKCFIGMLHKFHTYVASVFIWMSYVLQ
jgi:hypothetical protein